MSALAVRRIGEGPILHPGLCPSIGDNLNGPTLLRAPDWAGAPAPWLLYFGHHEGRFIRLALAERPEGPWRVHRSARGGEPRGVLHLAETWFAQTQPDAPQPDWAVARGVNGLYPHISSPEVWVDPAARRFTMLFHGMDVRGTQVTARASSPNGLDWTVEPAPVSDTTYLRAFRHGGRDYAIARLGEIQAMGADGRYGAGIFPFERRHRHAGVLVRGDRLHVFWTRIGDAPEAILHSTIDLSAPFEAWRVEGARRVLAPERDWEGAGLPVVPTPVGTAAGPENGLRDPYLVADGDRLLMVYAGAGESVLGLAELTGL